MHLNTNDATRFFAVLGAPYIAESHFDICEDSAEVWASQQTDQAAATLPAAGAWLHGDH